MAFSAKRQPPKASPNRRTAVRVPGSPQLIAPKSPSKLTKKLTMAPGGPEYDSPGDYRPPIPHAGMQQSSPGPQEQRLVQHRQAPPTWRYARQDTDMTAATGDRRGTTVGSTGGGPDSVGLRRIQTSRTSDFDFNFNFNGEAASPRGSIFSTRSRGSILKAPAPHKLQQNSPGMESISTATGEAAWSPGRFRYGRVRRYTEGGGTQVLESVDLPQSWIQEHENTMKGMRGGERGSDPQAWRHSSDIRKWEKRMHGDASTIDHDAKNRDWHLERQAHDQYLSDSFRAPGSMRARSCEALVSNPGQRTMRAAFTDRALKQAHMQGQVALWSPKERDPEVVASCPVDMPPAGTSRGRECLSVAMHNMEGATTPKGDGCQYPKNSNSQGMRKLIEDSPSEDPSRDLSDLRQSENAFRNAMGVRRRGDMSPTAPDRMRARSVDSAAGICRKLSAPASIFGGGYDPPLRSDGTHNAEGGDWTSRKTGYAAQESNHFLGTGVSRCLSPRGNDAAVDSTAPLLYCRGGAPATERFTRTKYPLPPGSGGRPDFWFDTGSAYDTGRRMGRGEPRAYSAESRRHSIRRDCESENVYKFELIATGEGKPRATSQPPEYNPVLHTGTPRESRMPSRKKGAANVRSSASTGRLLNFEAGREEDQALSTARMANDKAFSDICSAISQRSEVRSQEAAQIFTRSHQTRSSNMALLLKWE